MGVQTFIYPTSAQLRQIEQELLPQLEAGRLGLELFPIVTVDEAEVIWEQMDKFTGLQQLRGMNGSPTRVKKTGASRFSMKPGLYGEFEQIDEGELTRRRQLGTFGQPVNINDLTGTAQTKLLQRRLDRIEWIIWTLLSSGTFFVANENGVLHTDSFNIQTFTATPLWSVPATATPVKDLRNIRLQARGVSTSFGAAAKLYCNQKKVVDILNNSNAADLGKYTQNGGDKLVTLEDVNRILIAQDLPQIVEYDRGYIDDNGTFQTFIPDGKGILIGPRTSGASVGEYQMTRNANNPDLGPGPYTRVIDRGEDVIPRTVEVHDGHNGGPAIFFPGSVVAITC
jgi:hypothetical protein